MLPPEWTERIFAKLTLTYGRDFFARYEGQEAADVIEDWAHGMDGFYPRGGSAIAWALDNLPERPPNVREFRALARQGPFTTPDEPMLTQQPSATELAQAQRKAADARALIEVAVAQCNRPAHDPVRHDARAWARALVSRRQAGEPIGSEALRMARRALGLAA